MPAPAEYEKYSKLISSADSTVAALTGKKFNKTPVVQIAPGFATRDTNIMRQTALGKWLHSLEQSLGHTDPIIEPNTAINPKDAIEIPATGLQLALMARMTEQTWVLEGRQRFPASRITLMDNFKDVLELPTTYLGDRANALLAFFRTFEPTTKPTPDKRIEDPNKADHPYDATRLEGLLHRCSQFYIHAEELERIRVACFEAARNQIRRRLQDKGLYDSAADYLAYYTASNIGLSRMSAEAMLRSTFKANKEIDNYIFQPFGKIVEISAYEIAGRPANSFARQFQFHQVLTGINPRPVPWENTYTHPLAQKVA